MNNSELIQILEAVYTTKGGGMDCEDVLGMNWFYARGKAIAALSAKPESTRDDFDRAEPVGPAPCAKCGYNGPGYYQPGTHSCVARSAKANVVRLVCVGCGMPTDNVVPQCRSCCTNWFDARDKAIAALSKEPAKPPDIVDWLKTVAALSAKEPAKPEPCCGEYATCLRACTPRGKWMTVPAKLPEMKEQTPTDRDIAKLTAAHDAKLPEDIEQWLAAATLRGYNSDKIAAGLWLRKDDVRTYLQQLTAAHAAKLAAIEHERSGVEGAMYARILALEAELAEKEKTK
jgi:hypothetical protein